MQMFHIIFTEPGKVILEVPCRSDIVQLPSNPFEILCRPNPEWMMVLPSSVAVRMDGRAKNIATCHKLRGDASERADE